MVAYFTGNAFGDFLLGLPGTITQANVPEQYPLAATRSRFTDQNRLARISEKLP